MCLGPIFTNNKSLDLITQGYKVLAEYRLIEQKELKGIYAIPSWNSGLLWFGVIFIHGGIYSGSVFRFSILLPNKFPEEQSLPTVIFQKNVFHPHICPISNRLDLTPLFPKWNKDEHHIWHVLMYIQAIFADPEGSICTIRDGETIMMNDANNVEAMRLLATNRVDFALRVHHSIAWSCKHMFDDPPLRDPHYIILERYSPQKHLTVMERIKSRSWYGLSTSMATAPPSECLARIDSTRQLRVEDHISRILDRANTQN